MTPEPASLDRRQRLRPRPRNACRRRPADRGSRAARAPARVSSWTVGLAEHEREVNRAHARSRYDTRRKVPQGVAMSRSNARCTSDSLRLRYSIRSAMVPILRPCSAANSMRSGRRAIEPSSRMISHSTAAGVRPARRASRSRPRCGRAHQHAAGLRDQREHVPRLDDVLGLRILRGGHLHGERPVVRRDAGGDALGGLDRDGEVGAVARAVLLHHRPQPEALGMRLGDRHADQAAPVLREEVDLVRAYIVRGEHEVALVLAVLVVDQDDDLAGADRADDLDDRADGDGLPAHGDYRPAPGQPNIAQKCFGDRTPPSSTGGAGNSDRRARASA